MRTVCVVLLISLFVHLCVGIQVPAFIQGREGNTRVKPQSNWQPTSSSGVPPEPLFPYFHNVSFPEDQVDVAGTMGSRMAAVWDALGNICCNNKGQCGGEYCARSCPANCWLTGWQQSPSIMISSFDMSSLDPASYVPTLIVAQNYTNFSKNQTTSATFSYNEQYTDTYTVSNEQTLSIQEQVTVSAKIKVLDLEEQISFGYSTTTTTTTTKSDAKQWAITWGPTPVPPCTGVYIKCYILTANYYPDFTANYVVDGTPTCKCDGNWWWDPYSISQHWVPYCNCVTCSGNMICGNCIHVNPNIQVKGKFSGIVGALAQCDNYPYDLDPTACHT